MPYRRNTTPHARHTPEILPVLAVAVRRARAQLESDAREATPAAPPVSDDERPRITGPLHGRWWTRTTDLFLIREAL